VKIKKLEEQKVEVSKPAAKKAEAKKNRV